MEPISFNLDSGMEVTIEYGGDCLDILFTESRFYLSVSFDYAEVNALINALRAFLPELKNGVVVDERLELANKKHRNVKSSIICNDAEED